MAKKDMKKQEACEIPEESLEKVSGGTMTAEDFVALYDAMKQIQYGAYQAGVADGTEIGIEQGLKQAAADIMDGPDKAKTPV